MIDTRNTPVSHDGLPPPLARYSHGIMVPPGARLLVTSGQLGMAAGGDIPEDAEAQAEICFRHIGLVLEAAGMMFEDVVRFNAYVTDRAYFPVYGKVRSRYVAGDAFASTLLIVSGFTLPAFKIEVEVTAARMP